MKTMVGCLSCPLLLGFVIVVSANGETYTWVGGVSSEWNNAANWNPSTGVPRAGDVAVINSGTPAVSTDTTVARLELYGGSLGGAASLTVTNALVWSGGSSMQGGGMTVLGPGGIATLSGDGDRTLQARTFVNRGTLTHARSCRVLFYDQSQFEVAAGGVVDLQSDATWLDGGGVGLSSLTNRGAFRKSGGTGISTLQNLAFDNRGTLGAWQGTLYLAQVPTLGAGTKLEFGLAGTTHPDRYGRITCSHTLPLAGELAVVLRNGFTPGPGQQFDIIAAPVQGAFGSYAAPPISPTVFINPVYGADGVSLVTTDPTPTIWGLSRLDSEQKYHLSIHGIANLSYVVLGTTDFEDRTLLATNAVPASTVWEFIDVDSAVLPFRFYQVLYQT